MDIYVREKTIFDYKHPIQNRMEPYYGYIYFSYNLVNGKKYIGQCGKKFTGKYFGSGRRISKAIKKYRKQNFLVFVLEWCDYQTDSEKSKVCLNDRELFWIKFFNAKPDDTFYNVIDTTTPILRGEQNGFYGKKHKKESLEKRKETISKKSEKQIKEEQDRKNASFKIFLETPQGLEQRRRTSERLKGKTPSKESIEKARETTKNRPEEEKIKSSKKLSSSLRKHYASEEGLLTRQKMSESRKGKKKPESFGRKISTKLKGRRKTKEHVDKINKNPEKIRKTAEKHRGMKRSQETRDNISKSKKGKQARNKGEVWYYDPINKIKKSFTGNNIPPSNWIKGTGKVVYYDPKTLINYTIWEGEQLPNWIKGRYKNKR